MARSVLLRGHPEVPVASTKAASARARASRLSLTGSDLPINAGNKFRCLGGTRAGLLGGLSLGDSEHLTD
jgi:hypothetical protein